jgi:hypothetical protein
MESNFTKIIKATIISQIITFKFTLLAQISPSPWIQIGVYNNTDILNDSVAKIYFNNRVGVIDIKGDTLVKPMYTSIFKTKKGCLVIYNSANEIGLLNEKYKEIIQPKHSSVNVLEKGIQAISNNRIIFYDFDGREKQDSFYSKYHVRENENNMMEASIDMNNYGVLNENTKQWILQPEFDEIDISNPNFFVTGKNDDYKILNIKGEILHDNKAENIITWGNYFLVRTSENSPYHIFDRYGKPFEKLPIMYGKVICLDNNLYQFSGSFRYIYDNEFNVICEGVGIIGLNAKPLGTPNINYHTSVKDQNLALHINYQKVTLHKYSKLTTVDSFIIGVHDTGIDILNNTGKVVFQFAQNIAFIAGDVYHVPNVLHDSVYFFYTKQFLKIPSFHEIYYRNRILATRIDKIWNILDINGKILVSDIESVNMQPFDLGFTYTKKKLIGWHSAKGYLPCDFDQILIHRNGLLYALKNKLWKLYTSNGTEFSPFNFANIMENDYGLVCNTNEKTFLLLKDKSDFIEFQEILQISKLYFGAKTNDKWEIYKANMTTLNSKTYKEVTRNSNILKFDNEYFVLNFNTDEIAYHDFDTMYYISEILIGKKNDSTTVFTTKGNLKRYVCDSISSVMNYAAIYKNGKITVMDVYNEIPDILDVEKIIYANYRHKDKIVIVQISDRYEVYNKGKRILSLDDPNIKIEITNYIISYIIDGKKYIYDIIKNQSLEKNYDIYKIRLGDNYIVENNFKYGMVDKNHKEIIPCKYEESFRIFNDVFIEVRDNSKSAVYDLEGTLCIPLDDYDVSFTFNKNYIFAKRINYYGYYDIRNKKWYPSSKYQDIKDCNIRIQGIGDIYIFVEKGKYGLMNDQCNVILSPEYESIETSLKKFILTKNKKQSVIFLNGKMEKSKEYDYFVTIGFENFWIGGTANNFDLYHNDKFLDQLEGRNPDFLSNDYLSFIRSGKGRKSETKYIYDLKSKKIILSTDKNIASFLSPNRLIIADQNFKYSLVDADIRPLHTLFDDYQTIRNNWIRIKINGKYGIIDFNGNTIIEPKYDNFDKHISNYIDIIPLKVESKIDIYDKNFKYIKSLEYNHMGTFTHNLSPVRKGMNWGFIDTSYKEVIPLVYDYCNSFYSSPISFVFKDKKLEFIDTSGKPAQNPKNLDIIVNEILECIVESGNYNKENYSKIFCTDTYVKISDKLIFKHGESGKYGLMNPFYDIIIPATFDEIKRLETDFKYCYGYRSQDKWGIMDTKGVLITDPIYDRLETDFISKKLKISIDSHSELIDYPKD